MSSIWAGVNTSHPSRSFFRLNETAISFRCQKFNSLFKKSKNVTLSRRSCLTDFKICKKRWLIDQHEPIVTVAFCGLPIEHRFCWKSWQVNLSYETNCDLFPSCWKMQQKIELRLARTVLFDIECKSKPQKWVHESSRFGTDKADLNYG